MSLSDSSKAVRLRQLGLNVMVISAVFVLFCVVYHSTMPRHYLIALLAAAGVFGPLGFVLNKAAAPLVPWYALIRIVTFVPAIVPLLFLVFRLAKYW